MALLGIPHVWTNRDKPIGVQFRFKKTCLRNLQSFGTRIGCKPIEHTPKWWWQLDTIQAIVGFPHCKWDKKGLINTTVVRAELEWFHMVSPEIMVCPKRLPALFTQQPIKPKVCIVNPGYYPPEMMVSYWTWPTNSVSSRLLNLDPSPKKGRGPRLVILEVKSGACLWKVPLEVPLESRFVGEHNSNNNCRNL